jgi:hypothetical protein
MTEREIDLDDILPWEWKHVFDAIPYEPREVCVMAIAKLSDRWIESYKEVYQYIYSKPHPVIGSEDRLEAREAIISIMMYGIEWMDFDRMVGSYLRSSPKERGYILVFLKQIPILNAR